VRRGAGAHGARGERACGGFTGIYFIRAVMGNCAVLRARRGKPGARTGVCASAAGPAPPRETAWRSIGPSPSAPRSASQPLREGLP